MHKAHVLELGVLADALALKAREQRGRAGSIETLVVIEDPYPHNSFLMRQISFSKRIVQNTRNEK